MIILPGRRNALEHLAGYEEGEFVARSGGAGSMDEIGERRDEGLFDRRVLERRSGRDPPADALVVGFEEGLHLLQ